MGDLGLEHHDGAAEDSGWRDRRGHPEYDGRLYGFGAYGADQGVHYGYRYQRHEHVSGGGWSYSQEDGAPPVTHHWSYGDGGRRGRS